jgi:hypothetical protein
MHHRCPWCLEPLDRHARKQVACPHCDRTLRGPDGEPRELDLRYQEIEARQRSRVAEVLQWGVPSVAVLALAASILHVGGLFLAPAVAVGHLLVLRIFVVREARRHLGPTRRLFTRWATRFAFLWLGLPGYAAMPVPLAGVVAATVTFAVLTGIVHFYTEWSLGREHARQPMMVWEKIVVIGVAAFTLAVALAVMLVALLVGWSAVTLFDVIRAG